MPPRYYGSDFCQAGPWDGRGSLGHRERTVTDDPGANVRDVSSSCQRSFVMCMLRTGS